MTKTDDAIRAHVQSPLDRALAVRGTRPVYPPRGPDRTLNGPPVDFLPDALVGSTPAAEKARGALEGIHSAWTKVAEAAGSSVDLNELSAIATKAVEKCLASADKAREGIEADIEKVQGKLDEKIAQDVGAMGGEIRGHFRHRDSVSEVMEQCRKCATTASAVLSAPPYLSGLNAEQHRAIREAAIEVHAPEEGQALAESRKALGRLRDAQSRMLQEITPRLRAWSNPEPAAVAALREMGSS